MKRVLTFVKIIAAIAILWFLTHTAQINFSLFHKVAQQPLLLFYVMALFLIMVIIGAWRWHLLNTAQGIHLGFVNTIMPIYLSTALNNLLPGAVGGDVARLFYLFKKNPEKKSAALLSIFFDRVIGFMAIALSICLIASFYLLFYKTSQELSYLLCICLLFCTGLLILFFIFMLLPGHLKLSQWLNHRFPHHRFTQLLLSFLAAVHIYQKNKMVIAECLAASLLVQMLVASATALIAKMLGFTSLAFSHYLIAVGITQIVNLIPLTPGGIGIGETAFAHILLLFNPGVHAAFATIFFVYRLISLLTYLPGAICYLPKILFLKKKNPLQEESAGL